MNKVQLVVIFFSISILSSCFLNPAYREKRKYHLSKKEAKSEDYLADEAEEIVEKQNKKRKSKEKADYKRAQEELKEEKRKAEQAKKNEKKKKKKKVNTGKFEFY